MGLPQMLSGLGAGAVRGWWLVVGLLAVGLGGLGVIVPGLPSTVFFLIAAWCFTRSSRRLERWVLNLPGVGPLVRDARAGLGMPRRIKVRAITVMWAAISLSSLGFRERPVVVAVLVALGAIGTFVILRVVPTTERVMEGRIPEAGPDQ